MYTHTSILTYILYVLRLILSILVCLYNAKENPLLYTESKAVYLREKVKEKLIAFLDISQKIRAFCVVKI